MRMYRSFFIQVTFEIFTLWSKQLRFDCMYDTDTLCVCIKYATWILFQPMTNLEDIPLTSASPTMLIVLITCDPNCPPKQSDFPLFSHPHAKNHMQLEVAVASSTTVQNTRLLIHLLV